MTTWCCRAPVKNIAQQIYFEKDTMKATDNNIIFLFFYISFYSSTRTLMYFLREAFPSSFKHNDIALKVVSDMFLLFYFTSLKDTTY